MQWGSGLKPRPGGHPALTSEALMGGNAPGSERELEVAYAALGPLLVAEMSSDLRRTALNRKIPPDLSDARPFLWERASRGSVWLSTLNLFAGGGQW